jgi:hypothetical protein
LFPRPTTSLGPDFKSDSISITVKELSRFVKENFGESDNVLGPGKGYNYIASEIFGIIDQPVDVDDTILFVVDDLVNPINKTPIRLNWRRNLTRLEEAVAWYTMANSTDENLELLLEHIRKLASTQSDRKVSVEDKQRLISCEKEEIEKMKHIWAELRLKTDSVFWSIGGVLYRGGLDYMLYLGDEFDKNGVMKSVFPSKRLMKSDES